MYRVTKDVEERLSKVLMSPEVTDMLWHIAHTHTHRTHEMPIIQGAHNLQKQSLIVFCTCIV
jgi:hypothetical protein